MDEGTSPVGFGELKTDHLKLGTHIWVEYVGVLSSSLIPIYWGLGGSGISLVPL